MLKGKKLTMLVTLALVLVIGGIFAVRGFIEVDFITESSVESADDHRSFTVTHEMDVTYQQLVGEPEIILVLDRSNSMLEEGFDGMPVAQTVWDSVNDFINKYFAEYPEGQVAVVSFGTNAVKNDNWKYYYTPEEALNEVANIYSYSKDTVAVYDYVWQNNKYLKTFVGYEYTFFWHNWNHENGGTNIKEAFEYAETTIWHKDKDRELIEIMPNSVVIFSDGVATHGGIMAEEDLLYPTSHNTNTSSAILAYESLSQVSNVVSVGYFEGVMYPEVVAIARDTLQQSQNGGYFEAGDLTDIDPVFAAALDAVKYVGSEAMVKEVIPAEFELELDSVLPREGMSVSYTNLGETVITWNLGSLRPEIYNFSYDVNVRANKYPTGKQDVNLNPVSYLTYTDLYGNPVEENFEKVYVDVWPLEDMPFITMTITHENASGGGYLTGDDIQIVHELDYTNSATYKFDELVIANLSKTMIDGNQLGIQLNDTSWSVNEAVYKHNLNETITDDVFGEDLVWNQSVTLSLDITEAGEYKFVHDLDYIQVFDSGVQYEGYFGRYEDVIPVKESLLTIDAHDDLNNKMTDLTIYIDETETPFTLNEDGTYSLVGLSSGWYELAIPIPNGYTYTGVETVSMGVVKQMVPLNYMNPEALIDIQFEKIGIEDISVEGENDSRFALVSDDDTPVPGVIKFKSLTELDYLRLQLQDDFSNDKIMDGSFVLDRVVDSNGVVMNHFEYNPANGQLIYNSADADVVMAAGTYTAYGSFYIPESMNNSADETFINIDVLALKVPSDIDRQEINNVYSDGLTIRLDNEPPIITLTYDEALYVAESKMIEVDIEDLVSDLEEYFVVRGEFTTEEELMDYVDSLGAEFNSGLKDLVLHDSMHVSGNFVVATELEYAQLGYHLGGGVYTIYAKDTAGNVSIINVNSNVLDELPDNI